MLLVDEKHGWLITENLKNTQNAITKTDIQLNKVYFALTVHDTIEHFLEKNSKNLLLAGFISNYKFNKIYFVTIEGKIIGRS